jgi:hypothetical protein
MNGRVFPAGSANARTFLYFHNVTRFREGQGCGWADAHGARDPVPGSPAKARHDRSTRPMGDPSGTATAMLGKAAGRRCYLAMRS